MDPKRHTPNRRSTTVPPTNTPGNAAKSPRVPARRARTRKHETIDISRHPSNSFVTLHIASTKLQTLGIPAAEKNWKPPLQDQAEKIAAVRDSSPITSSTKALEQSSHLDTTSAKRSNKKSGAINTPDRSGRKIEKLAAGACIATTKTFPSSLLFSGEEQARHRGSATFAEDNNNNTIMAPVRDPNNVQSSIKNVVQNLFEIQTQVHGFVPETQPLLIEKMSELAQSLAHLQKITSPTQSPNNPIHQTRIAPEIIDYVDDGRNPDIFTRDFVELVQRGNAVINGKQQAFREFSEILASALKEGIEGVDDEVDKVMKSARGNSSSQTRNRESKENGLPKP